MAPPWTSLSDAAPATPVPLPLLLPPLAVEELPRVMVAVMPELSLAVTDTPPPAWMVEAGRSPVSKSMLAWHCC